MKRLWKHIAECKDQQCPIPHCVSSRFVLSHYHRCKDLKCAVCAPVREVIAKSHQRQMSVQARRAGPGPQPGGGNGAGVSGQQLVAGGVMSSGSHMAGGNGGGGGGNVAAGGVTGVGGGGGNFAHQQHDLTAAQRQQLEAQRLQQAAQARQHQQNQLMSGQQGPGLHQSGSIDQFNSAHGGADASNRGSSRGSSKSSASNGKRSASALVGAPSNLTAGAGAGAGSASGTGGSSAAAAAAGAAATSSSSSGSSGSGMIVDPAAVTPVNGSRGARSLAHQQAMAAARGGGQAPQFQQPQQQQAQPPHRGAAGAGAGGVAAAGGRAGAVGKGIAYAGGAAVAGLPGRTVQQMVVTGTPGIQQPDARATPGKMLSPEDCTSLIEAFTEEQILNHVKSLDTGMHLSQERIQAAAGAVLTKLRESQFGWVFNDPVDPVHLNLPDYFEIITNPMDLGTVARKLAKEGAGGYLEHKEFAADVQLVFDNAMKYNGPESEVYPVAERMKKEFMKDWGQALKRMETEENGRKERGETCNLCGFSAKTFEPMTYYCNGAQCNGKRIGRGRYFYHASGSNQWHWCTPCYNDLKDGEIIALAETAVRKADLKKKKNDEQAEEPWVECDSCKRWVHQICALFNSRKNSHEHASYYCPHCVLKNRRQRSGNIAPTAHKLGGKDLPHGPLSTYVETQVKKRLQVAYEAEAAEKGIPVDQVTKANKLYIREVSVMDTVHLVKPGFHRRYGAGGEYPADFPVRSKCIVLFQELDGVDVLLFGMYVYEYGHTCPAPNQRRVYISYLDSVHYFRPRNYRTMVYHEILIAYLEEVKKRGFHTAHIWACPPAKGDDYILYCHPAEQQTPKDDRLQQWYVTMLEEAKKRGIVEGLTNLYDEYWPNPETADARLLPYLEGDYWIGEAENIIKDLPEGTPLICKPKVEKVEGGDTKPPASALTSSSPATTPANPTDAAASAASAADSAGGGAGVATAAGAGAAGAAGAGSGGGGGSSTALVKIEDSVKKEEEGASATAPAGAGGGAAAAAAAGGGSAGGDGGSAGGAGAGVTTMKVEGEEGGEEDEDDEAKPQGKKGKRKAGAGVKKKAKKARTSKSSGGSKKRGVKPEEAPIVGDPLMHKLAAIVSPMKSSFIVAHLKPREFVTQMQERRSKEKAIEGAKKAVATAAAEKRKPDPEQAKLAEQVIAKDETEEGQATQECEVLDTRQTFLNLCQGNHYQFDMLRRAKHSSMMVLYHLCNPDVPKFLSTCSQCYKEIHSGDRYHCETCTDFDLCKDCYKLQQHPHPLKAIPVRPAAQQQKQLSPAQREERQRHIKLHMQLLQHASTCEDRKCQSKNCSRMKNLLTHGASCAIRAQGGCGVCKRIWALLQIHARQCKKDRCSVPKCRQLRQHMRFLREQQQAMDDRRRQAMNEWSRNRQEGSAS